MTIAVTGATGYLGSHMLLSLHDRGVDAVGVAESGTLPPALLNHVLLSILSSADVQGLATVFETHDVTGVIHFAGNDATPAGSLIDPMAQYDQILTPTLTALRAATLRGIEHFVFSSTASVYGVPQRMPIREETPLSPISPFGAAMGMAERIVADVCRPACIGTAILRYFNVAGADPNARAGETGHPRHLIKAAAQIATGVLNEPLKIYGNDYNTPDGTCIRDYIHVSDMAEAHATALDHLMAGGGSVTLNCGYGRGISVHEVIAAVQRVTGKTLPTQYAARRQGDAPLLIADTAAIRTALSWVPRYDDIDVIIRSAIQWEEQSRVRAA
ncbi:UDP-glucose 4-epimerase [Parvularcula bermudensis HTCC2503]|uniref:UDP-glucose 4-epimerase n=1 Tax=Parvularcula bermudensis (strain ATCC BAA-594 / HTCC2503 / KCTC 12087) TaxID=314260 RepID=E0TGI9_PARBH|nr:UDP-glucose 4-epimerase GalE [Parvularcula bermudensis]ADM09608.1 UDP-glucose 4-epimerase [Parvularcula bermudensis HTCC2503]